MINQNTGLSNIPTYVSNVLCSETLELLKIDGMGLSFPHPAAVQLRVVRGGINKGKSFNYNQSGSISKAIQLAIELSKSIRENTTSLSRISKNGNVCYYERYDKRKNKTEYGYRVFHRGNDGKMKAKTFSFGHNKPSTDKQLHGFRTAKLFRFNYEIFGLSFHLAAFTVWKHQRLYKVEYEYFDWKKA
jgi:hypothetical protein